MAFCEGQLATFATTGTFPADLVMATAKGDPPATGVGTRCEGREDGRWYKVKILKTDGERSFVHWIGYAESEDAWVAKGDPRPYDPPVVKPGERMQIRWEKTWYPGRVLRSQLGLQLVHHDGYEGHRRRVGVREPAQAEVTRLNHRLSTTCSGSSRELSPARRVYSPAVACHRFSAGFQAARSAGSISMTTLFRRWSDAPGGLRRASGAAAASW